MEFSNQFDVLEDERIILIIREKNQGDAEELPYYYYDICLKPLLTPIGKISIRIGYNKHAHYNGHIGYEIDPTYRGHHYSLSACRLVLNVAKYHGMDKIYITCKESNLASQKIIARLGAQYIETVTPPPDYLFYYDGIPPFKIYCLKINPDEV